MANIFRPTFEPVADTVSARPSRAALGRQAGARSVEVTLFKLRRGEAVPQPSVPHHDEVVVMVLSGAPSARGPREWRHLTAGDVVVLPTGSSHSPTIVNQTRAEVTVLVISRPWLEVYDGGRSAAGGRRR